MHWFLKFFLGMKLCMFRTVPLSIIRSFSLYAQQWCMSYRFADSLWAVSGCSILILPSSCQQTCMTYEGVSKSFETSSRPPTDGSTWMSALCLGAGNVTTQHAEWRRCVNIGSGTTRVFVTTCAVTFAILAWAWNWSREQASNSAWNSANLQRRLFKMIRRVYGN